MAEQRSCRGRLSVAAVSIVVALAAWGWVGSAHEPQTALHSGADPRLPAGQGPVEGSHDVAQPPDAYAWKYGPAPFLLWAAGSREVAPRRSGTQAVATDPVDSAPDLKRVFDAYIDSDDPQKRRAAARAFEACVPAFLPGAGQSASPEALIDALPADRRSEREAAYRSLFARCHRLFAAGRTSLGDTLHSVQAEPQSQPAGLRAQEALLAGRLDDAEVILGAALSESDPAAIASLAGISTRIARLRRPDSADAAMIQRAQETDAALPWVACDLGLDCSAQSLWALQLCATEGLCEGDVLQRLMARNAPDAVDPQGVQQQRSRLLGLIRSNRVLGMADLLPQ